MNNIEDLVQNANLEANKGIKKSIFDIIAVLIVAALALASLDIFDILDISTINWLEFLVSWLPYLLATMLLTADFYKKGVFVGKQTKKFKDIVKSYSDLVESLSGSQVKQLNSFCNEYNSNSLVLLRTSILKEGGISYEDYDSYHMDETGKVNIPPLKILSKKELEKYGYNAQQIQVILKANKIKVKGINVNLLLSNSKSTDPTDVGEDEKELSTRHLVSSVLKYIFITFALSLVVIKDISTWGWASLIIVAFKVIYMLSGSFMHYFRGYDDITLCIVNHISRKSDILKMYLNYEPASIAKNNN